MNEDKQVKILLVRHRDDERSVLYANENVTNTLFKKFLKSTYPKDRTFLSLLPQTENEKEEPPDIIKIIPFAVFFGCNSTENAR